jgi:hypothetical protein
MSGSLAAFYHLARDWFRRRALDDEFVRWLGYANAGMLKPGNAWSMDYAIRNLPSASPLVEVGSFAGLSANVLCHLLRKHGRGNAFFTCDNWDVTGQGRTGPIDGAGLTYPEYAAYVRASFVRNVEFFSGSNRPFAIESSSEEFFRKWERGETATDLFGRAARLGGPIAFCYLDGVHSIAAARREFESVDHWLDAGGFILFDDSADSSPFGLDRLMRDIASSGRYELVQQNPNYFFRKR